MQDVSHPCHHTRRLKALVIMNAVDMLLTLYWVLGGAATELNPVTAALIEVSPALFVAAKVTVVPAGILTLWWWHEDPLSQKAAHVLCWLYGGVLVWHVLGAAFL